MESQSCPSAVMQDKVAATVHCGLFPVCDWTVGLSLGAAVGAGVTGLVVLIASPVGASVCVPGGDT